MGVDSLTILMLRVHATGVDVFYLHAVLLIVVIDDPFSMHTQRQHSETCVRDVNRCLRVARHVSEVVDCLDVACTRHMS